MRVRVLRFVWALCLARLPPPLSLIAPPPPFLSHGAAPRLVLCVQFYLNGSAPAFVHVFGLAGVSRAAEKFRVRRS